MIVIIAQFDFPPESRQRVLEIARDMDTRTNREIGCIHYRHAVDASDENRVVLSEIWSDAEALSAHFRTPHFRAFRNATSALKIRATIRQLDGTDIPAADERHWSALLRAAYREAPAH